MDWSVSLFSLLFGLPFLISGWYGRRHPQVRAALARRYTKGAGVPLQPERAARGSFRATEWMGYGILVGGILALLPLPLGLKAFFPLWLSMCGMLLGYALGWRAEQKRACTYARSLECRSDRASSKRLPGLAVSSCTVDTRRRGSAARPMAWSGSCRSRDQAGVVREHRTDFHHVVRPFRWCGGSGDRSGPWHVPVMGTGGSSPCLDRRPGARSFGADR